ncbi:hypothetical protein M409DRAFT_50961 [Zasmidium cellare ATCC 36951]|uniref:Uncharacterized protein n=1 Tax=Zasmidium cellare ATCC 36951 TaxID=1080233 RepID=A0A6A6CXU2_ZASCE|nr:uncharacterized protein M409DRAFT_50961 [Zasmidium cellare ATCC 36951]KAF2171533.1 hypothetical protein M409DRAFT_50961 [Zasmidium cellare ATCC 36951]
MSQPWRRASANNTNNNQENRPPTSDSESRNRRRNAARRTPLAEISNSAPASPRRRRFERVAVIGSPHRSNTTALPSTVASREAKPEVDEDGFKVVQHSKPKTLREKNIASTVFSNVLASNHQRAANAIPLTTTQAPVRRGSGVVPPRSRKTKLYGVLWSEQISGIIVRRLHHCRFKDPNVKLGDQGVFEGPDGRPWIKKWRYFLILRQFGETVAEIPIYTFGNRGLEMKPSELHCEYLSIKPVGVAAKDFRNESPANPVLNIEKTTSRYALSRLTMVARFTEICTRSLDCDELLVIGNLDKRSTETLLEYAYKKVGEGYARGDGGVA